MASAGYKETLTADGQTEWKKYIGPVVLIVTGTIGGGTVKLQQKDVDDVVVDIPGGSFTDVTSTIFDFPVEASNELRVDLSGSTTPDLGVTIQVAANNLF